MGFGGVPGFPGTSCGVLVGGRGFGVGPGTFAGSGTGFFGPKPNGRIGSVFCFSMVRFLLPVPNAQASEMAMSNVRISIRLDMSSSRWLLMIASRSEENAP